MSDTPRTDEQINGKPCTRFAFLAGDSLRDALVPSEFARELERELASARLLLEEKEGSRFAESQRQLGAALRHNEELKAENAALRETIQQFLSCANTCPIMNSPGYQLLGWNQKRLNEAYAVGYAAIAAGEEGK